MFLNYIKLNISTLKNFVFYCEVLISWWNIIGQKLIKKLWLYQVYKVFYLLLIHYLNKWYKIMQKTNQMDNT